MSDQPEPRNEGSLAARIDSQKSHPLAWKEVVKRAVVVAVAGISIYLVFPTITEVFASWPRLSTLDPRWFTLAVAAEVAHFTCTFALQRLALRTRAWFPVITSQLAGNAITLIVPGGAAVGAAVQFRMLAASGRDTSSTVGGLAAFSLLGVGGLLALPVFALPVILVGAPTNRGLVNAAILGAVGFVAFAALGAVILAYDAPLRWCGRTVQRVRNAILRKRPPMTGLDESLLAQRNEIRAVLGAQWWQALLLSAGRLAFDYLCLLFALRATGARPRPSLILVAYAVAGVVGMIPATPGGLGLVEASLTGLLVLAEVNSSQAVLATLTYRLASYWLPLLAGPVAYGLFRLRYRTGPRLRSPARRRRSVKSWDDRLTRGRPRTGAREGGGARTASTRELKRVLVLCHAARHRPVHLRPGHHARPGREGSGGSRLQHVLRARAHAHPGQAGSSAPPHWRRGAAWTTATCGPSTRGSRWPPPPRSPRGSG